jgi:hypothetical protein
VTKVVVSFVRFRRFNTFLYSLAIVAITGAANYRKEQYLKIVARRTQESAFFV